MWIKSRDGWWSSSDQPDQPEGVTAQPSDELGMGAPPSIPPTQPEGGHEEEVKKLQTGGCDQLHSPCYLAQSSIFDFFKRKIIDITMTDRVKKSNVWEGVAGGGLRPEIMVTSSITTDDCSNNDQNNFSTTPSMRNYVNHKPMRMIDYEGSKEDISNEVGDMTNRDCDIVKRRKWCNTHEGVVKSVNVSSIK